MKKGLTAIVLCLCTLGAFAQRDVDENSSPLERIYTGGGLQLSFGSNTTIVGASPLVGYMITDKWSAGVGVTYIYYKLRNFDLDTSVYGGRLFTRYNVFNPFFVYGEYELLSYDLVLGDADNSREVVPALNLGGGISQPLGRVAAFQIIVLYDVLHDDMESLQPNAFSIRGGITVGF